MENQLEFQDKLCFNTGDCKNVYLIDSNSAYYFYISQGSRNIEIAPVGSVKNFEMVRNKRLNPQKDN